MAVLTPIDPHENTLGGARLNSHDAWKAGRVAWVKKRESVNNSSISI